MDKVQRACGINQAQQTQYERRHSGRRNRPDSSPKQGKAQLII